MPSIAVSAAHPFAIDAARAVAQAGGGAVDAAIAAQAMITVVLPQSAGLGGDGLSIVSRDGELIAVNGTGRAPAHWPRPDLDVTGQQVTVPGVVQSWFDLHAQFGEVPLEVCLTPAIRAAREGILVDEALMASVTKHRVRLTHVSPDDPLLQLQVGDLFTQPAVAHLLERIVAEGPSAFYSGSAAAAIVGAIHQRGGTMTAADFATHASEIGVPIAAPWNGGRVHVQPPSSQGVLLAAALHWLDPRWGELDHDKRDHLLVEVTTAIFDLRDDVILGAELFERVVAVDPDRASSRRGPRAYLHTAGVATADDEGTIVSSLVSVFDSFGSAIYVPELGIRLNNRAAGFTAGRNAPRAGERPVHTLAPALVEANGATYAIATPGADGQVQTLLQVLCRVRDGEVLEAAIAAARWRSQDGSVLVSDDHPSVADLRERGHQVVSTTSGAEVFGAVVCAGVRDGGPFAVSDWRRQTASAVLA